MDAVTSKHHHNAPSDEHNVQDAVNAPLGTIYTCPMHPEIRQDHPGNCPKCGMTLEPIVPSLEEDNPELADFRRRFWWTLPLTIVITPLAMFGHSLGWFDMRVQSWVELVLSLPVVLWAGRRSTCGSRQPREW
jgi:Cu+-exporting ATPase